ncbi:single-stranded-DNA-specific exonuclease RecJ (plasmid) [Pontibacillus sp. ALD_SL1]|uniref:single-stranded-DNA-specific exonuclease RecJ n=1 Tax=Pontibacillus sp. ALD_SL1 TaxID=2777185 RepID=UPI001A96AB18|nr:single-stranded-DNA-specific exonuclease RecJ [Pontibacillus sp. ALD_SL1]QST03063.1 single-stranded-DNA-specific exonuclease RecJ [Pontibacillus sp. ALD_SL1]
MPLWRQKKIPLSSGAIHLYAKQLNIHPFVIQYLSQEGYTTMSSMYHHLYPSTNTFHDPFLLQDMKKSVFRILKAIKNKETILIFGDYDVDGITSTSLMVKALRHFGADPYYKIPLREEGYGISAASIERIKEEWNPSLIITVDNGSSSHEAMKRAKDYGIDVIVTDHHEILEGNPDAYSFINPKRKDNSYPHDHLSGVGVAFKLVQAMYETLGLHWKHHMGRYIELVAVGTVADLVPLLDENRTLVQLGLERLNKKPSLFFSALMKRIQTHHVTSTVLAFNIAPILNSSGRISDPNECVSLITSSELKLEAIDHLLQLNKIRKEMTKEQTELAIRIIDEQQLLHYDVLLVQGDFHDGIIGIIASRIAEKYSKPAIIMDRNGKASCRSIPNSDVSIIEIIESGKDWLTKYGGHPAAAGLSVSPEHVNAFREVVQSYQIPKHIMEGVVEYHHVLPVQELCSDLLDDLVLLEPFGMNNPAPLFLTSEVKLNGVERFGKNEEFMKCSLGTHRALCFRPPETISNTADCLYKLNGNNELLLEFIRPASKKALADVI